MSRAVEWSAFTRRDLAEVVRFIAEIDPEAAARVADRIDRTATAIATFSTARPGRVAGTFEKSVVVLPYIIAYAHDDRDERTLVILHVVHGVRDWPSGEWPRD